MILDDNNQIESKDYKVDSSNINKIESQNKLSSVNNKPLKNTDSTEYNNKPCEFKPLNPINETLYINNLNEKINQKNIKKALYNTFSKFGKIKDIKMKNTLQMRGQAFVIFEKVEDAIDAASKVSGSCIYKKLLKIDYAKSKSYLYKNINCTESEENDNLKHLRKISVINREKFYNNYNKKLLDNKNLKSQTLNNAYANSNDMANNTKILNEKSIPTSKLFISDLAENIQENEIKSIFERFQGFKEIRYIKEKKVCFVEFENVNQASKAAFSLNKTKLGDHVLNINYAKM